MSLKDDGATETTSAWDLLEQLVVGVLVLTPGVLWQQGTIGFEAVVVTYLAASTFLVAMVANEVQK